MRLTVAAQLAGMQTVAQPCAGMANYTFLPPMATVYVVALPESYMTATRLPSGS